MRIRGPGDLMELVTTYTGIKWLTHKLVPNCRCDERRDWMNRKWFELVYWIRVWLARKKRKGSK